MRRNHNLAAPQYPRRSEFAQAAGFQLPPRSAVVVLTLSGEAWEHLGNALRLPIASSVDSSPAEAWLSLLRRVECCAGTRAQE